MNTKKKIDVLTSRIDRLESENKALKEKNRELLDKISEYRSTEREIENLRIVYSEGMEKIKEMKERCQDLLFESKIMKAGYEKEFKSLIHNMRKNTKYGGVDLT